MGRPGSGGGHSVSRSGGGHSVSRSGSGHRVGGSSSSRPMGSSRPSGGGFGGGRPSGPSGGHYGAPPPPRHHEAPPPPRHYGAPPPPPRHHGAPPPPPGRRRSGGGCISWLTSVVVLLLFIVILWGMFFSGGRRGSSGSIPSNSYNREKLDSGNGYINDCIYDELGWFDNESRTESRLKDFYNETGVQPYIMLLDYIPELQTDAEKDAYAHQLYEDRITNESTFLYVYFANENENEYSEPGYMYCVNGTQVGSVMDSEAVDIFWAYLDKYWSDSSLSADDMFVKTFNSTATRIMTKSTTSKDVAKYALIVVAAGVVVFGVVKVVKLNHKRAKEEAEETERILNTPMDSLVDDELKKTAAKYDEKQ